MEMTVVDIKKMAERMIAYLDASLHLGKISLEEHIIGCGEVERWLETKKGRRP